MPRRDDTFLLYYVEDFAEYHEDNPQSLVCLSESTIQLCLSALRFSHWPTRWRENRDDNNNRLTGSLWAMYRTFGTLAEQELMSMGCQEIAEGLNAIAASIAGLTFPAATVTQTNENNCSSGSGSGSGTCWGASTPSGNVGTITQPGSGEIIPIYGTEEPLSIAPGEFPEGFTDREEFDLDRCQVANGIIDGVISALHQIAAFGVFNASGLMGLLAVVGFGLVALPVVVIPLLAAAIIVLGVNVALLESLGQYIQDNREDWVCAVYDNDNVEAIISTLADMIDAAIVAIPIQSPWGASVKTIAMLLLNGDTLNQMMKKTAHLNYEDADCSGCGETPTEWYFVEDTEGWEWTLAAGELPEGSEGQFYAPDPNDPSTGYLLSYHGTSLTQTTTNRWEVEVSSSEEFTGLAIAFGVQYPVTSVVVTVFSPAGNVEQTFSNQGTGALNLSFSAREVTGIRIDDTFTNSNPTFSFSTSIYSVVLS